MADLAEISTWETGIYQFEEADVVQGGPAGIDNVPTRQLANRTLYLKNLVDALGTGKLDLSALASQVQAEAGTDNTKWMTPLRVAQAIAALAAIAMASETVAGKVELATVAETITGTDTARATHAAGVKAAINAAVASLVNSSPTTLDTLNELANALGNDPNFATTMTAALGNKAPIASPAFTGVPTATTATPGTASTQLATTEFADRLRDVSSNPQNASYTLDIADRGKSIDFTGPAGQTITIPANSAVALPVGSTITFTNNSANVLSIAINTDTLRMGGTTNVGTRTLAAYGVATARKVAATTWIITGNLS